MADQTALEWREAMGMPGLLQPEGKKQLRGEPLIARILESTLAELARVGWENLSVESVAARSGANKTTLYRRWPTRDALMREAFLSLTQKIWLVPDTGNLRGDLIAFAQGFREMLRAADLQALIRMHIGAAVAGELSIFAEAIHAEKDVEAKAILVRASKRGELRSGVDIDLLYDLVVGALLNMVLVRHRTCDDTHVTQIIDIVLTGAESVCARAPENIQSNI